MSRIVWVHREFFDKSLDRTTWVEMARALAVRGYGVHMVCSYQDAPIHIPEFERMTWIGPSGPGVFRRLRFVLGAWLAVMRAALDERPDLVILDEQTVGCAFPIDASARAGLLHTKVLLDMRTVAYGVNANDMSPHDRVLRFLTRVALLYNRALQQGLTVIVPALADLARSYGSRSHIGLWGSGVTLPEESANRETAAPLPSSPDLDRWRSSPLRLIYHGSIGPNRGLDLAVQSLVACRKHGVEPMLLLLGSGPTTAWIAREIARLGAQDFVIMHPPVPHAEVCSLIAAAHLGLMIYPDLRYWDFNHPIKLMEYLGAGVPVLCSDIRMFRAVDPTGDVLIFTPASSPAVVARSIVSFATGRHDHPMRVKRGYVLAADNTWDRQAGRLLAYAGLPERSRDRKAMNTTVASPAER